VRGWGTLEGIYTYISMCTGDKDLSKGDSREIYNTKYGNTYEEDLKLRNVGKMHETEPMQKRNEVFTL
jgi:hypothetical protein